MNLLKKFFDKIVLGFFVCVAYVWIRLCEIMPFESDRWSKDFSYIVFAVLSMALGLVFGLLVLS